MCHYVRNVVMDVILRFPKIDKPLVVYRFYCMALFHSQTRRHMINIYTNMHGISKKVMENNVVSDKLKVSLRLTSGGKFVAYIVHPMCSDGYIKIVSS